MKEGLEPLKVVLEYHEETKHQLDLYARSLGYMDWANQPDPFRRYHGAPQVFLEHLDGMDSPEYDAIFDPGSVPTRSPDIDSVSRLFYDSLAISAWKQAPGRDRWALRVNPSSGNLHPTEAYLICGALPGISKEPGIYHYSPFEHVLERRIDLTREEWQSLANSCRSNVLFVALTSIYWREAWKYGERAFRYCNHDIGHALGAVALAASSSGWYSRMVETVSDDELGHLLSLGNHESGEAEYADCLLMLSQNPSFEPVQIRQELLQRLSKAKFNGRPNRLSKSHHHWPAIDHVSEATKYPGDKPVGDSTRSFSEKRLCSSRLAARQLFRGRRSAVAMDASVSMSRQAFYTLLARLAPGHDAIPFMLLPWSPLVSLVFFVHRVRDLKEGMYFLVRSPEHVSSLRNCCGPEFLWQKPEGCPEQVHFFLLAEGDFRNSSKTISCHQNIAADGVFSVGMLARFESVLRERGPWYYKRLHWECGLIGQLLYLEAEAAGINGTGIGCFHDDVLHQLLGLEDHTWQTLYHFTVGKALEDFRLKTVPAYHHLGIS